jgi:Fe-S cluster assembly protein SufD
MVRSLCIGKRGGKVMGDPIKADSSILHELASHIESTNEPVLKSIRESSLKSLNTTRFPTPRDEDWRFLDLKPITRTNFVPVSESGVKPVANAAAVFYRGI